MQNCFNSLSMGSSLSELFQGWQACQLMDFVRCQTASITLYWKKNDDFESSAKFLHVRCAHFLQKGVCVCLCVLLRVGSFLAARKVFKKERSRAQKNSEHEVLLLFFETLLQSWYAWETLWKIGDKSCVPYTLSVPNLPQKIHSYKSSFSNHCKCFFRKSVFRFSSMNFQNLSKV